MPTSSGHWQDDGWCFLLGTDAANRHCVAVLWADKIAHLTGTQNYGNKRVISAYHEAARLLTEP